MLKFLAVLGILFLFVAYVLASFYTISFAAPALVQIFVAIAWMAFGITVFPWLCERVFPEDFR